MINKGREYIALFSNSKSKHFFVGFTQILVESKNERRVDYAFSKDYNTIFFNLYTTTYWGGEDLDQIFARTDDDLIKQMLNQTIQLVNNQ